jgi:hypothetical protein
MDAQAEISSNLRDALSRFEHSMHPAASPVAGVQNVVLCVVESIILR